MNDSRINELRLLGKNMMKRTYEKIYSLICVVNPYCVKSKSGLTTIVNLTESQLEELSNRKDNLTYQKINIYDYDQFNKVLKSNNNIRNHN